MLGAIPPAKHREPDVRLELGLAGVGTLVVQRLIAVPPATDSMLHPDAETGPAPLHSTLYRSAHA